MRVVDDGFAIEKDKGRDGEIRGRERETDDGMVPAPLPVVGGLWGDDERRERREVEREREERLLLFCH